MAVTGVIESIEFDSTGSNVESGASRSDSLWILKVPDIGGYIYVHAVFKNSQLDYILGIHIPMVAAKIPTDMSTVNVNSVLANVSCTPGAGCRWQ